MHSRAIAGVRYYIPVAQVALQVVQMDLVVFGDVFAFTAIDIFHRESAVLLRPALEAVNGYAFLHQSTAEHFGGHVESIRTDGGSLCKEC